MSAIGQAAGIEHGTIKGWRQHNYRKVEQCDPCRKAYNAWKAEQRGGTVRPRKPTSAPPPPLPSAGHMYLRPYPPYPPGWTDPAWGEPIKGRDLQVGDTLVYLHADHETHVIDRFEPYRGGLNLGAGARTACSGTWEIAVAPDATVRILPREAA